MESNIANEEYFYSESPLDEPHFDEEATLLSARRVVPLQEIKADESSRKRLAFGLAIAFSIVAGALGTALIYREVGQEPAAAVSQAAPGAAGITSGAPLVANAQSAQGGVIGMSPAPEIQSPAYDKKSSPSATRNAALIEPKQKRRMPPQTEESEATWDERYNERRLRRVSERDAWRESGRHRRRSSDDLMRIRDIFEGPQRP